MPKKNTLHDVFKYIDMQGPDDCWPWSGPVGGRAREPRPYFTAQGQRFMAYRLVYSLVHGVDLLPSQLILHSCDNGMMPVGCCNPAHLRIGDQRANSDDMTARQRHGLPHSVVRAIKTLLERGKLQQDIADLYGVSRELITAINNERVYKNVRDTDTSGNTNDTAADDGSREVELDTNMVDSC